MSSNRATDASILASVAATLRSVLAAEESDAFLRTSMVQVTALAEHAARRGPDPARARRDELSAALDTLAGNELLGGHWPGDPFTAAARALAAAVGRSDAAADAVRDVIRPILIGHLDADLASTPALLDAFRGRLNNA